MSESHLTPMFRQWRELKQQHPDCLLLFRMGDFYEMFADDAKVAAKALDLTLTARQGGQGNAVPMCGIPYHALDRYLPRLVRQGFLAAIVEQTEDPKLAKGLVNRDVVRIVTPGTLTEDNLLEVRENNYLVALADGPQACALAVCDISTGEFRATSVRGEDCRERLLDELERLRPAEVLWPLTMQSSPELKDQIAARLGARVTVTESGDTAAHPGEEVLCRHFGVAGLQGFGLDGQPHLIEACATALRYAYETQRDTARHITSLTTYSTGDQMSLDAATRRNLELVTTLRDGTTGTGTLLGLLDATLTPMGARLLRSRLVRPLQAVAPILERLDAVAVFHRQVLKREDVRRELQQVADLERLVTKATSGRALPRDLVALRVSLQRLPALRELVAENASYRLVDLAGGIEDLSDLAELLEVALVETPPANLKDGGYLRDGYSPELDELRRVAIEGKEWIASLEARERQATGVGSLKVGYNQVFGYYLEVTRSNLANVPDDYVRKQTLANAERFITPELKDWETKILASEERLTEVELGLFEELRTAVAEQAAPILSTARAIAEIDVYAALAHIAAERGYVRPDINDSDRLVIRGGRHPIVEATQTKVSFVPNDTTMDGTSSQVHIVTGPNMAGKSTYLRQVALIVLLAQVGSFVPADAVELGVVDRIFTRVGAQDDLATGQSTFMVEMTEAANILHNATRRSLVILDEIGRGTSTYDGMSIAWAVVEYLHDREQCGAKTLFATHYHYLNELEERLERVRNYRVTVSEDDERIRFLHRIEPGGTDRSYGIQVARLAGLPLWVIERAGQILAELEQRRGNEPLDLPEAPAAHTVQLALFDDAGTHPALTALRQLDVMRLTPIDAINRLHELQRLAREEE